MALATCYFYRVKKQNRLKCDKKQLFLGGESMKENKPKMAFALIYPSLYQKMRTDSRTEEFLKEIKEALTLKEIIHKWEEAVFPVERHYSLFKNSQVEGIAHVGKKGSNWVAQVSLIKGVHYFDIVRYMFKKAPTPEMILQANVLNQVYAYFQTKQGTEYYICTECEKKLHWLDGEGDIEIKWERLKERDCGCQVKQ